MSFLLRTPERVCFNVFTDSQGYSFSISTWRVSTSLGGSYTQTRGDAARIVWERNNG